VMLPGTSGHERRLTDQYTADGLDAARHGSVVRGASMVPIYCR
jgi:hypothetical protein